MISFYTINSMTFSYPKSETVLENINLSIDKNQHIGLIGPNGSGKTTLVKLMMGILKPKIGQVFLNDKNISEISLSEIGKNVGFVFQNPEKQLFAPTVLEQIGFSYRFNNILTEAEIREKTDYYLDLFGLIDYKKEFPFNLSLGQKQRLALASILSRDANFLILDEPGTGLDVFHLNKLNKCLQTLRSENKGFLIISHDKDFLTKNVDKLLCIKDKGVELC